MEQRALKKSDTVRRARFWGLFLFVAIPLPGTGAWTGSLIAAMLEMRVSLRLDADIDGKPQSRLHAARIGTGRLIDVVAQIREFDDFRLQLAGK